MARVLVVDDAAFMRKMVSDALTKGGHEVVGEAGNGVEAVARFQELKPELMTLDITMPEKDGLAALKEIIELDPSARVIMCSALGQESKVLESIKLGAQGLRRQAVPGRSRPRGRRQGARLATGTVSAAVASSGAAAARPAVLRPPAPRSRVCAVAAPRTARSPRGAVVSPRPRLLELAEQALSPSKNGSTMSSATVRFTPWKWKWSPCDSTWVSTDAPASTKNGSREK